MTVETDLSTSAAPASAALALAPAPTVTPNSASSAASASVTLVQKWRAGLARIWTYIREKFLQFISLYTLSGLVVLIGVFLVEINQRSDLLDSVSKNKTDGPTRIETLILYGSSDDYLKKIVHDTLGEKQGGVRLRFDALSDIFSDVLGDMSSRTLLLLASLFAGWSGSLVGSVYRREPFSFRVCVIGLGASFVVWLGSHSTIQLVSLGAGGKDGEPQPFDLTMLAFIAGFAAQKVMENLDGLANRSLPRAEPLAGGNAAAVKPVPNAPIPTPAATVPVPNPTLVP